MKQTDMRVLVRSRFKREGDYEELFYIESDFRNFEEDNGNSLLS